MQRIVPNVWCNGNAAQMGEFYAATLPNASSTVTARYPDDGLPDFQKPLAGQPLVVDVTTRGYVFRLINAGPEFRPTPAISFILPLDQAETNGDADAAQAQLRRTWAALSDGGQVRMPLDAYPFSKLYGWVEDRHGVSWQLMLTDPDDRPRPSVIPQFLFTGGTPRADEAISLYTRIIPDSAVSTVVPHPDPSTGVMSSQFTLAGQQFSAMDGGPEHDFTFTPGVSLQIDCSDQDEIDRVWDALSAVPEAEQCGWLADRFGVSWQVVPAQMEELMQHPGAYQRMLQMKKLIIAEL